MTINLSPRAEELVSKQLARGAGQSPEEVVERALETVSKDEEPPLSLFGPGTKTPAEAVDDIFELQKRNRLAGLKIKDLIHEGHKY